MGGFNRRTVSLGFVEPIHPHGKVGPALWLLHIPQPKNHLVFRCSGKNQSIEISVFLPFCSIVPHYPYCVYI